MITKLKKELFSRFFHTEKKQLIDEYLVKYKQSKLKELDFLYNQSLLNERHFENSTLLLNRVELLKKLPQKTIGVELGVDHGDFSSLILKYTLPERLHLIDKWGDELRYHDGLKTLVLDKFKEEIKEGKIVVNLGYSTDELKKIENNYFDWAYLDTVHDYECTKKELKLLSDKVKDDGLICGHDFIVGNWSSGWKYGVIEAVYEFCSEYNYEFVYLTMDFPNSFAIRKIS
ncbi:class I SAM-dependent methyltransferase [Empedobacter falsenii]